MVRQAGPLAARVHRAPRQGTDPIHLPGNQIQPSSGIHLDDVRWGAAGVPRPLHTLHRAVWRDADFQRPPRSAISQFFQGEPNCHGNRGTGCRRRVHPP